MTLPPKKRSALLAFLLAPFLCVSCAGTGAGSEMSVKNRKNLASSYARGGDFIGAVREMEAAEKQAAGDPEIHFIKGIAYFGLKDPEAAESSYKKALKIDGKYTKARYNLCGLYIAGNKPDAAIRECSVVSQDITYPLRYAAFVNIARAYDMKNDTKSAEKFLKKSLKIEPSNIYSKNEYGKLLSKLSKHTEAAAQFRAALRLAPGYNEARLNLAASLIKSGDTKSACAELGEMADRKPSEAERGETKNLTQKYCGNSG
ncbi:MAG: tetratricopeptide repeat protein [Thermodesulfobacteriota bacterium]